MPWVPLWGDGGDPGGDGRALLIVIKYTKNVNPIARRGTFSKGGTEESIKKRKIGKSDVSEGNV